MPELNKNEIEVEQYLKQMRELKLNHFNKHPDAIYLGMEDFLLQHGLWYRNTSTPDMQGAPRCCFGNAILLAAQRGYRYVEGVALAPLLPFPVHHGWNLTPEGELFDSTWMNGGLAYIGVEFSLGRADNASWFDDATVLDNPRNRFKIYREPWTGENFNIKWRFSKHIRWILKRNDK